jgi:hypothetical protein
VEADHLPAPRACQDELAGSCSGYASERPWVIRVVVLVDASVRPYDDPVLVDVDKEASVPPVILGLKGSMLNEPIDPVPPLLTAPGSNIRILGFPVGEYTRGRFYGIDICFENVFNIVLVVDGDSTGEQRIEAHPTGAIDWKSHVKTVCRWSSLDGDVIRNIETPIGIKFEAIPTDRFGAFEDIRIRAEAIGSAEDPKPLA